MASPGETGEIVLSGPSLMKGYYRAPEATAARMSRHGFHTGDYASADRDGFLYYEGRRDDIFKSAGEKISTQEIEDVVLEHEAVSEAAVVPLADPERGRRARSPTSCCGRGCRAPSGSCRRSAAAACPGARCRARSTSSTTLRKTSSGKVQKYRLKDLAAVTPLPKPPCGARRPTVPWGCWDPEATLDLPFPPRLLGAGQRHA